MYTNGSIVPVYTCKLDFVNYFGKCNVYILLGNISLTLKIINSFRYFIFITTSATFIRFFFALI